MAYDFVIGVDVGNTSTTPASSIPKAGKSCPNASISMKARYASSSANSSPTTPRSLSLSISPTTSAD